MIPPYLVSVGLGGGIGPHRYFIRPDIGEGFFDAYGLLPSLNKIVLAHLLIFQDPPKVI